MKWVGAIVAGQVVGWMTFMFAHAFIASRMKLDMDKQLPSEATKWAMCIAFAVIALSWAGFFKGIAPPEDLYQRDY